MSTGFAKTTCQHCSGHIEFDAGDFAEGETRTVECPHCHMDTLLFVRPLADTPAEKPKASLRLRDWVGWVRAIPKPRWMAFISTTKFERMVFGIIRGFALFWAALMVLALVSVTFNYLRGFPTAESGTDSSFASHLVESKAWQNFGLYMAVVSFLLFMLTTISIVLLLLAIERNTRKDKHDVAS